MRVCMCIVCMFVHARAYMYECVRCECVYACLCVYMCVCASEGEVGGEEFGWVGEVTEKGRGQ